jgi:hypothetical protein
MTKSWEKGENEYLDAAKREAMRTGQPVAEILQRVLDDARRQKDKQAMIKIRRAQKYIRTRNKRRRRRRR